MDMNIEELLEAPFKKEERRRSRSRSSRRHRRSSRSLSPSSRRSSRRHRSRSRGEHRRDKDRDRSRSSHRRSDRDREREKERDRRRSPHSTERDSRRRSDSKDKDRRSRRDDGLRYPVLSEAERDRRTVFIMQLAARVRSSDIADFFSAAGKVRDVRLITDRVTRKSKGVGYVEFYEEEAVGAALAMAGQKLLGIPIIVQPTESEKNRIAAEAEVAAAAAFTGAPSNIFTRLYVGSLHFSLTEEDIKTLFEVYGPLDFVTLHKDETGRSKGFAFVQYKSAEHAKVALEKMHGYELKGRQLKVGLSTDKGATFQSDLNGGSLMDDDEKQGFTMSSHARVSLMAKLARAEDGLLIDNSPRSQPVTSRCVLLKNMFDPATETEPGWEQEIEDDVKSECAKFGKVVHGAIDRDSEGHVYLKFDSIPFAQNAINALNGRFFAGKQVYYSCCTVAEVRTFTHSLCFHLDPSIFHSRFHVQLSVP
ncbi:RNA binding motif protein 39b [Zopfochytrium polystomum]|nr:RNA binding motif protein 39b [Zopfochytrium polystomum]